MRNLIFTHSLLICIIALLPLAALAQNTGERYKKIESAKIAFLTDRLQLTPEQAEKFWPIYNQYQNEKRSLRRKSMQESPGSQENITEVQAKEMLAQRQELKRQEVALDEKYIPQLVGATSAKQILDLGKAETEFRRILLQRLRNRK